MNRMYQYNIIVGLILGIVISFLLITAVYLEPISGDLTRLGGYSENEFGWKKPQEKFTSQLFDKGKYDKGTYDKYYDIVVFGDSFSYGKPGAQNKSGSFWQNFIYVRTGLSIITFDLNKTDLNAIIEGPAFKRYPPRIFIYESIERDFIYIPQFIGMEFKENSCKSLSAIKHYPKKISSVPATLESYDRYDIESVNNDFLNGRLSYTADFLQKNFMRYFLGIDETSVIKAKLVSHKLFSNKKNNEILIYKQELQKRKWSEEQLDKTICSLIALQNHVQKNGKTNFNLLIAPDKSTVYSKHILDKRFAALSHIDMISNADLNVIRVDKMISESIDKNIKDIYLPNDTHWSSSGHKIAADAIIEHLKLKGLII